MRPIYKRALEKGVEFECSCVDIKVDKWNELMEGAKKGNHKFITAIAISLGIIPKSWKKFRNPYQCFVTDTHLIYVHSAIEHFIKVND